MSDGPPYGRRNNSAWAAEGRATASQLQPPRNCKMKDIHPRPRMTNVHLPRRVRMRMHHQRASDTELYMADKRTCNEVQPALTWFARGGMVAVGIDVDTRTGMHRVIVRCSS
jgi:hypothetical protein